MPNYSQPLVKLNPKTGKLELRLKYIDKYDNHGEVSLSITTIAARSLELSIQEAMKDAVKWDEKELEDIT